MAALWALRAGGGGVPLVPLDCAAAFATLAVVATQRRAFRPRRAEQAAEPCSIRSTFATAGKIVHF
jgi:hypothetical protein